jgi:multiple sugar transport system substrate-binding protein
MNVPKRISRRGLLAGGGGLAAAAAVPALAGCGDGADRGGTGQVPEAGIQIPDAKVKLPSEEATLRLVDSNDTKTPFWKQLFAAYQKKHANITCQYDGLPWNKIEEIVPLGIRNKTAHDVIQLPSTIPLDQAVSSGWVAPLDDVIPDIQAWKKNFPELSYVEGSRVFDGKVYSVRLASDRRYYGAIHYSKKLMEEAGYDPQAKPLTWDDYRDAAKKITKAGKGRYYGVVFEGGQPARLSVVVDYLARGAGAASVNGIDLRTGEFYYTQDQVAEAIELMLALQRDGSVFPGSNSLLAPQTWPRVQRGNVGMVCAGPWVTVLWNTQSPDFEFGVAAAPVQGDSALPQGFSELGGDSVAVYAGSEVKTVAVDVLTYVTSLEGQTAWAKICGVGNPPVLDAATKAAAAKFTPQAKQCVALGEKLVANPEPLIANPEISKVFKEQKALSPDFGQVIQGIFVGKITDVKKALTDLKDRSEQSLDAAIAAAVKKGAKVSRDDWVFKNWDPAKSYTKSDYDAR